MENNDIKYMFARLNVTDVTMLRDDNNNKYVNIVYYLDWDNKKHTVTVPIK